MLKYTYILYQSHSPEGWKGPGLIWSGPIPSTDYSVQSSQHLLSAYCMPSTMLGTVEQRQLGPRKRSTKKALSPLSSPSSCCPELTPQPLHHHAHGLRRMPLTGGRLSPLPQKGAEHTKEEEAADTSRAALGRADRLGGEDNSSKQQVLGDKLLEASYRALSPWALPRTRQPPASLLVQLCICPVMVETMGRPGPRQRCGNPVTTERGEGSRRGGGGGAEACFQGEQRGGGKKFLSLLRENTLPNLPPE